MRKVLLESLDSLFAAIAAKNTLYIPVDTNGGAKFEKWQEGKKLSNALHTTKSPKDFFFPQSECLMKFKTEGKNIEIIDTRSESEDFAIFGVRACDARAFKVLDNVFLKEPVDTYYQNRREHGIIISLACDRPAETCFCGTFDIDAANPDGDIVCYKTESALYLDAKTEKGQGLLAAVEAATEPAEASEIDAAKQQITERLNRLPLADLKSDAFGAGKTDTYFNAPEWKELSEACLGCGTCTFVCPTCQCYDIKDFNTGHGVIRHRCWDSCMYSEFTKMSAGQPRLTQLERFRQRFMHKLVYYPENNDGLFSCVGCGRCVSKCPIGMNIVKVMKKLGGSVND
ncbi:MAG TPA: 4Fe-4S dicluster domain-containing protein [Firmicutes bacterium]|nr:4Fe-4S dicluster domain-containing protein [Bacillota bacterium]